MKRCIALVMIAGLVGAAGPTVSGPDREAALIKMVSEFSDKYGNAASGAARTQLRKERAKAICANVRSMTGVTDWTGTIEKLSTTLIDGRGMVRVRVGDHITVGTYNGGLLDPGAESDSTLNPRGEPFKQAFALKVGQKIRFDGLFMSEIDDCYREQSFTEGRAMRDPDFVFMFSGLRPE